jgi:hypothetical protein
VADGAAHPCAADAPAPGVEGCSALHGCPAPSTRGSTRRRLARADHEWFEDKSKEGWLRVVRISIAEHEVLCTDPAGSRFPDMSKPDDTVVAGGDRHLVVREQSVCDTQSDRR